ncbi:MAG: NAD(P)H-dependent flavin oxidoreductase [Bacillota bacterium]
MKLPELKIGKLTPEYPVIQGGMAIKVSMAELAGAVAEEGGIGVIGGTVLTVEELRKEIRKAREKTDGIIGVNIMFAASNFKNLLKTAVKSKIDVIISGAGFSRDMFSIGKKADIPVVPIVSSLKLARISEKLGAAAVVVEGGNAGGHLGTEESSWDLIKNIKNKLNIPIIAAGDIVTPADMKAMFELNVNGVQMGTRFLASLEASVSNVFKKLCVKAEKKDVVRFMSSVGFPGNAIKTGFIDLIKSGQAPEPEYCDNCLKECLKNFCIKDALLKAKEGDLERGVFFSGRGVEKVKEILPVKDIFDRIRNYFD